MYAVRMRTAVLALLVALACMTATEPLHAHHGSTRVSVGVGFGFGYPFWGPPWGPWYWPPYSYYYPVPVAVPAPTITYVEQRSAPRPASEAWWYYCENSRGYYPYVKACPGGWQRVAPLPPPAK